jgi:hypothetical protein
MLQKENKISWIPTIAVIDSIYVQNLNEAE